MLRAMMLAYGLWAACALAACGGGGSGSGLDAGGDGGSGSDAAGDGGGGGPTAQQACAAQANARCTKLAMCEPYFGGVSRVYPDMDTCVSRNTQACLSGLMAPMTAQSATHVADCTAAIVAESCADFRSGVAQTACLSPAGPMANGAACVANAQCASAFCTIARGAQCGACAAQPAPGDSCQTDSDCGQVLACSTNLHCATPAAAGAACGPDAPCRGGLACVRAAADAGEAGTCQALGTTVGAPCNARDVGSPRCDFDYGLYCNSTNQCAMGTAAMAGEACGITANTPAVDCVGGATCEGPAGSKTCVAPALEGQPCDTATGPFCLAPARCITAGVDAGVSLDGGAPTAGVCRAFDPTACQ